MKKIMIRRGIFATAFCLLSVALPAVAAPTNLSPTTDEANPIPLLSDTQWSYLYVSNVNERCAAAAAAEKIGRDSAGAKLFCFGAPVTLSWEGTADACTVSVKRLSDGKVVLKEPTGETSLTIYNLEIGAQYEWTVTCGEESASATFWTDGTSPRLIRSGEMRMMRDLGGWTGTLEGKQYKIRQNLIFRGAAADSPKTDEYLADDTARAFFRDVVGLRNEVDFRNLNDIGTDGDVTSKAKSTGMYKLDPEGKYGIAYNNINFTAGSSLPKSGGFPKAVKFMTDPDNLPAYFHCKSGRDRTGMMAGLLLAVLGVSEEDIRRDYQTTSDKDCYAKYGFKTILETTLPNYRSSKLSLAENAKAYLNDIGLTDEQIENFRKKMLIGYGEPPEPEWWIEEPVYVTATRVTFAAGESTGTQYRGFLTKKGCEYAWGKNGEPETEWKPSDGTPMELKKPDEVQPWELMVR